MELLSRLWVFMQGFGVGWMWRTKRTGYVNDKVADKLILTRLEHTDQSTVGELCVDGEHQCWTLEPTQRIGIGGPVCIPIGRYEVLMQWSTRFGMDTPHLQDVPGRTFIEIHPGNFPKDTSGCILVGETKDTNAVNNSRKAFTALVKVLEAKLSEGKCWIEIS